MKIKKTFWAIGISACMLAACTKDIDKGNSNLFGSYDQTTMLQNMGNNILLNDIKSFSSSAAATDKAIQSFTDHPDISSLKVAQQAWTQLALDWAVVAPFDFGPMKNKLLDAKINTWPVNPTKINTAIQNQADATTQGADAKGLKALEYLLFSTSGNQAIIDQYNSNNTDASNRKKYLVSVSKDLNTSASTLEDAWDGNNNYIHTFIHSEGNNVSSSVSQIINTISLYLDVVKNMKIGNPIGMGVKINDNKPHPNMIEYQQVAESLSAMKANVKSMKTLFDGGSGQGLDDLLDYLKAKKEGKELSTVVDNTFDDAIQQIDAINPPYATAVNSQTKKLKDTYNTLKLLIAYFKVDVANNLGVTITFADTDGD